VDHPAPAPPCRVVSPVAALFGIDAASWGVIIAALALVVSIYSAVGARGSAAASDRAAKAAERSADATFASAEASQRSAGAAEASAQHSERSAGAAERSAAAHERAVELDERRAAHESRERAERDAPRWEPTGQYEAAFWTSDDNHLDGVLVNMGAVTAHVTAVVVELPAGGRVAGRDRLAEPGPADGGVVSDLDVRPDTAMRVSFQTTDGSLREGPTTDLRPRVTITAGNEDCATHRGPVASFITRDAWRDGTPADARKCAYLAAAVWRD
jgi:hypothetical protein